MNKLNKLYETLTNDERLKLFLQALARNDEQELDLLENSCPRRNYSMIDYKYTSKKVDMLVMTTYQVLDSYHCFALAMSALISMLVYEDMEDEKGKAVYRLSESCFNEAISLLKSKEEAWTQFL